MHFQGFWTKHLTAGWNYGIMVRVFHLTAILFFGALFQCHIACATISRVMNLTIDYKQMGLRIGSRRRELGMKQKELAEKAGFSDNYISSIETGKSVPTIDTLVSICLALDITPDYCLLGTMRPNNVPQNITDNLLLCTEDSLELISRILSDVLRYKVTRR